MGKPEYGSLIKTMAVAALLIIAFGTAYLLRIAKYDYLISLYAITAMMMLGLVVYLRAPLESVNFSFFGITVAIVLWAFSIMNYWGSVYDGEALTWAIFANIGGVFIPAFFLQFTECFPEGKVGRPFWLSLCYWFGPAILLSLAVCSRLVIASVDRLTVIPGPVYLFYMIYILVYFAIGFINLTRKNNQYTGTVRMQIRYIFLGSILCCIFPLVFNQLLPLLGNSTLTRIGPYFTFIFVAFLAYAITKHRLMDISVIISRATAEFLATFFLGVGYVFFLWAYRTYVSTRLDLLFAILSIFYGIFVEQAYPALRIFFQTTSDKLFLHGKYDYYKALSEASSKVGGKLALPDILKVLYYTFSEVVEIANPRIFLPEHFTEEDKVSADYVIYDKTSYRPRPDSQRIGIGDPLIRELAEKREPLHEVKQLSASLVIPCLLEDRLIGFFALGPKLSEDLYTVEDLGMLKTLANQAAITLDHTRSYEKIKGDLEVAERQLERSERLASLGTLTAGVTHEIRNPLTVIRAETERLANQERDQAYLQQFSALVLKHIDRISGIVQRMLQLAKEKEKQEVDVDLNEMIEAILQFFNFNRVTVATDLRPVPPIKGDPEAIQEVFVNLIQNALDAMQGVGELTLRTYKDDGRVVAEISDTGKGIPEEIREKIFDPFYSTRHEGVGLGLSIVHRIVREHGGTIKVESQTGKGTTFRLSF